MWEEDPSQFGGRVVRITYMTIQKGGIIGVIGSCHRNLNDQAARKAMRSYQVLPSTEDRPRLVPPKCIITQDYTGDQRPRRGSVRVLHEHERFRAWW